MAAGYPLLRNPLCVQSVCGCVQRPDSTPSVLFHEDRAIRHISSVLLMPPHNRTRQYGHCIKL